VENTGKKNRVFTLFSLMKILNIRSAVDKLIKNFINQH